MLAGSLPDSATDLFSHVTADKAALYRAILEVFAAAKRQFRLHLRPDAVLADAHWPDGTPTLEEVQAALSQLTAWGNLQAQPDTARVSTIEDFYRKRLLYRMTAGGEAVEASLEVFAQTLARRGELQSVALEDIRARLISLSVPTGRLALRNRHSLASSLRPALGCAINGDLDWAGLRIANFVMREFHAVSWRFTASDYLAVAPETGPRLAPEQAVAAAWDAELAAAMLARRFGVHEERVVETLLRDLAG